MNTLFKNHRLNLDIYKTIRDNMKAVLLANIKSKLSHEEQTSIIELLGEFIDSIESGDSSRFNELEPLVANRTKELIIKSVS